MASVYDIGDKPKITGTFTNAGSAADPAVVVAKYQDPAGTTTTLTYGTDAGLTKTSTGVYAFYISLNRSGRWYYRMTDNGVNVATEGYLVVRNSKF